MREQAMVLVRTIARDAPGLGREKGTIVQDKGTREARERSVGYV